ncbi:MAG: sulfotransferase [Spirochaetes bacterium]|nr:sulfotransferase [Spirochaetota bacterium]
MIFIDLSTFFLTLKTVLSGRWRSPRRVLWTAISILAVTTVYSLNLIGRLLDELLFPEYRSVEVSSPLIITANPRSGTTLLHRILGRDEGTFVSMKLYQTLFPSITLLKLFDLAGAVNRHLGRPFAPVMRRLDRVFFGGWEGVHGMGLGRTEEDEGLFLFNFATPALYMLFPFFREVTSLRFGDHLPEWKKKAIARDYLGSLKRILYHEKAGSRTLLIKSVLFHSRMDMLLRVLPDARVVYLMRDPCEALPSTLDMFTAFWRVHSPDIPRDSEVTREWARLCIEYYRYFHRNRELLDPSRFITMCYPDLVGDPVGAVKKIYTTFGMPLAPAFGERLDEEALLNHEYRSEHEYSLGEYGIRREWIIDELREIYDEYGLPR